MKPLTKYNLYKIVIPVLKTSIPHPLVRKLVHSTLMKHNIQYVDIGGAVPVSGYLVMHLSPVELYGIPRARNKANYYSYDAPANTFHKEYRQIDNACTLNYNLLNGIPIEDQSILGINMSHCLEHFTREDGLKILKECRRILKPGGFMRISCPDLKKYAHAYVNGDMTFFEAPEIKNFFNYKGLTSLGDLFINKAYDGHNGHKWFYDAESTIQLALEAGFKGGVEKQLHNSSLPQISIIEPAYREKESYYVEAYC